MKTDNKERALAPVSYFSITKVLFSLMLFLLLFNSTQGATYTVTSTASAGAGTLRQAIFDANANAGADVINFNISGGGVRTILLTSLLPTITGPVTINGYTQPGATTGAIGTRAINIVVDGGNTTSLTNAGSRTTTDGLIRLGAGALGSSISGLSIINTANSVEGILLEPGVSNIHIWGNYIGVGANGAASSATLIGDDGIMIGDPQVTTTMTISNITVGVNGDGVSDDREGNIIANNQTTIGGDGVALGNVLTRSNYSDIKIAGNYIGFQADGITPASIGSITGNNSGNGGAAGIFVTLVNGNNITIGTDADGLSDDLERNIIGNCFAQGINMASSNNIRIAGNYIGTDRTGTIAKPNGLASTASITYAGISICTEFVASAANRQASYNINIGYDDGVHTAVDAPLVRNIISGNNASGIDVFGTPATAGEQHNNLKIAGNYIGVDLSGNIELGNGQDGVVAQRGNGIDVAGATLVTIGTNGNSNADNLEGNVISGNNWGRGVSMFSTADRTMQNSVIAGNKIGVGADGVTSIGNEGPGVGIDASINIRIGSNDDGTSDAIEANVIANNAQGFISLGGSSDGVRVTGNSTRIRISRNSFYNNKTLAIDLANNGITLNDGATTTGQPNLLIDYPVITGYGISGSTMTVSGYVSTCNGAESVAGVDISGVKTIQFYKVANDGDQDGALTNGSCTRVTSHGEGVQYLGSITGVTNIFNSSFTLVAGATFTAGDEITAIAIDASGNTSEFGVRAIDNALSAIFGNITAIISDGVLNVDFSTTSEENNADFDIEASADGKNFTKIGELKSKAINGYSTALLQYSFSKSISGWTLASGLAFVLLSGVSVIRKRKMLFALVNILGIIIMLSACNKNESDVIEDGTERRIYIRIAQVGKDGFKSYSKVVTVTRR